MPVDYLGYGYAATVAAGGLVGYLKAGSLPSLCAGVAFGVVLSYGAFLTSQDPPRPLLQLGTSLALAGMMGARFARSGKFMPPGLICIMSSVMLVRGLYTYQNQLPIVGNKSS